MKEEWREVEGYENYLISNEGRVISTQRSKVRELKVDKTGDYLRVTLSASGVIKRFSIHRLVATAFLPNPQGLGYVNHKDGNKRNNCIANLEWCTCSENTVHAFDSGLRAVGEDSTNAKLTNTQVHEVCKLIEAGLKRGTILSKCPFITKSSFDDLRSRRKWHRITDLYKW